MSSRVFMVQRPSVKAPDGRWADKFDLSSAAKFGALVELLPRGNVLPSNLKEAAGRLREQLQGFNDADFMLPVGDPVAIALAAAVAADINGGVLRLLKWDRREQGYTICEVRAW
jgi:hypothetical protein